MDNDTTTSLVGPNGTAPGISFVQQQTKPVDDSSAGRGAGLPLGIAAVVILAVFVTILLKGRRARRPPAA